MGVFESFVSGLAEGFLSSLNNSGRTARIEELCEQLGWSIDGRDEDTVVLNFKDPLVDIRRLMITCNDANFALFYVFSHTSLPCERIPSEVFGYLLHRNKELGVGAWRVCADVNGNAQIGIKYNALAEGLTPSLFRWIAETLVSEASDFDMKMHRAGCFT